jgi:hypothetical protein
MKKIIPVFGLVLLCLLCSASPSGSLQSTQLKWTKAFAKEIA